MAVDIMTVGGEGNWRKRGQQWQDEGLKGAVDRKKVEDWLATWLALDELKTSGLDQIIVVINKRWGYSKRK
jgi:hypothetical protein